MPIVTAKLSGLAVATAISDDDLVLLTDAPGGSPASKGMTFANFVTSILSAARTFAASIATTTFAAIGSYLTTGTHAAIGTYLTVGSYATIGTTLGVTGAATFGNQVTQQTNVIRKVITKTAIADNVATEVFTITTANEAGSNDGGVYGVAFRGIVTHGSGPTLEASCQYGEWWFARALAGAGTPGTNSAVAIVGPTAVAASTAATKTITTITCTVVETSEYVMSVRFQVDIAGTTITAAEVYGVVELTYAGFLTPPVIASA